LSRSSHAIINLSSVQSNLQKLIALTNGAKIIAVVKADAYGNGAVEVAKLLEDKVDLLAVAFLDEALALRNAGINKTILILQGAHHADDFDQGENNQFIWIMHSYWQLDAYRAYLSRSKMPPCAWIKFDTGMHRLGFPINDFNRVIDDYGDIIDENSAIVTHLARSDEPDQSHVNMQIASFLKAIEKTEFPLCIANSATSIRFPHAHKNYVRLGIAMYGSTPFEAADNPIELTPVMSLHSQIIALRTIPKGDTVGYGGTWRAPKESVIATVAIGYGDGYPRHAPTGTPAWCNNQIIPLVGRVSMDMLTFDVSGLDDPQIGDLVELWGNKLAINDVAEHIGTIGYELMTRVSKRIPRQYIYPGSPENKGNE
jgi:alanine racemase